MSNAIDELLRNLNKHKNLIPNQIGFDTEEYTQNDSDNFRLAVILCHAELEVYFEDLANEIISKSVDNFYKNKFIDYCLGTLLYKINKKGLMNKDIQPLMTLKINNYINNIVQLFAKKIVDANNGINRIKIQKIFRLIGLSSIIVSKDYDKYDDVFKSLTDMRTKFVHKKYTGRFVKNSIDPQSLKKNITFLFDNMKSLDDKFINLSQITFGDLSIIESENETEELEDDL